MSTSAMTIWAVITVCACLVALVITDHRQPARRRRGLRRGSTTAPPAVTEAPTRRYRRPGPVRRLASVTGLGLTAVVMGIGLAVAVSVVAAAAIIYVGQALR